MGAFNVAFLVGIFVHNFSMLGLNIIHTKKSPHPIVPIDTRQQDWSMAGYILHIIMKVWMKLSAHQPNNLYINGFMQTY